MHADLWFILAGVAFVTSGSETHRIPKILLGLLGLIAVVEGIAELVLR